MRQRPPFIFRSSEYFFPEAREVQYCTHAGCGCPVVKADGAMEAHVNRVHNSGTVQPRVGAVKWVREWR